MRVETQYTETYSKPSQVDDVHFVGIRLYTANSRPNILGKWMVFKHYDEIDRAWEVVRTSIIADELQGSVEATCSTMRYNPTLAGPGPSTTAVICVFTEEHDMDDIGFKLIDIAKQDIRYKLEEDTNRFKYVHAGCGKVTVKTLFWNQGNPSFVCDDKLYYGTSLHREDIWLLNIVRAPEPGEEVAGRWLLYLEYEELTELWHYLKGVIESDDSNFGISKMVCRPKVVRSSPAERPLIQVYTTKKTSKSVGIRLIELVERDIHYEQKPANSDVRSVIEALYWNGGEPAYERMQRRTEEAIPLVSTRTGVTVTTAS